MSQAADEFLTNNVNLTALSYESATALGRLICTMTLAHQKKLLLSQSHVFVGVAPVLGSSIKCDNKIFESCMYQLAQISTSEDGFGETSKWDASDVTTLGTIVAGTFYFVPVIHYAAKNRFVKIRNFSGLSKEDLNDGQGNGLRPEALEGLTPEALSCMSSDSLKVGSAVLFRTAHERTRRLNNRFAFPTGIVGRAIISHSGNDSRRLVPEPAFEFVAVAESRSRSVTVGNVRTSHGVVRRSHETRNDLHNLYFSDNLCDLQLFYFSDVFLNHFSRGSRDDLYLDF